MKKMKMKNLRYNDINWLKCHQKVAKIQQKILEAFRKGNTQLVFKLQETLVSTFEARALAVRKVTSNSGKNTPGVDKKILEGTEEKMMMINELKKLNQYKAQPVRRVLIPKANGKMRPLGIPTIKDRCVQALYYLALDPIAEEKADSRSYGFRKYRSTQDVQKYLRQALALGNRARWILDADIKGFFDNISHNWILDNIPMNKRILKQWLKAGHVASGKLFESISGVPQGGIISPTIANMVLNGLEKLIEDFSKKLEKERNKKLGKSVKSPKINFVRYADDFVVTSVRREYLVELTKILNDFLKIRGVELNLEKTKIYHIKDGFDFVGFNFKKYTTFTRKNKEMLLIKPTKKSMLRIKTNIRKIFRTYKNPKELISELNPVLRGWANYYRYANSYRIFSLIDTFVFRRAIIWIRKKHPKITLKEAFRKYFHRRNGRWVFLYRDNDKEFQLYRLETTEVKLYVMIKAGINPYDLKFQEYLKERELKTWMVQLRPIEQKLYTKQKTLCPVCNTTISLTDLEALEIHHILPVKSGGKNIINNLLLLHKTCHQSVTNCKNQALRAEYIKKGILKEAKTS